MRVLILGLLLLVANFSKSQNAVFSSPCVGTFSRTGLFFDVEAKQANIIVNKLSLMAQNPGNRDIYIYYKPGTFFGFETTPNAWILVDSAINFNPTTALNCPIPPTPFLNDMNVCIPAGQRVAFYFIMTNGTGTIESHNNLSTNSLAVSGTDLNLYTGIGQFTLTPFNAGGPFTNGLTWQGEIYYTKTASLLGPDTTICAPQSLLLNVGLGYTGYLWSTGDTLPSITVNQSGTYYVSVNTMTGCTFTDTMVVIVDPCASIMEHGGKPEFVIADKQVYFSDVMISGQFCISNAMGQVVSKEIISSKPFSLSHLLPGLYTLSIFVNQSIKTKKFIIN